MRYYVPFSLNNTFLHLIFTEIPRSASLRPTPPSLSPPAHKQHIPMHAHNFHLIHIEIHPHPYSGIYPNSPSHSPIPTPAPQNQHW